MLKGILFIIAIIVTFDIGKALIESWNEGQSVEPETHKAQLNPEEEIGEVGEYRVIDLSLPAELPESDSTLEGEMDTQKKSFSETIQTATPSEKRKSIKARPIIKSDAENPGSPSVEGAKIDLKVQLN